MAQATQALMTLLDTIENRIEQKGFIPLQTICVIAEDITSWSHQVDLDGLDKKGCGIFSQLMNLVSEGMAGTTPDAQRALATIQASLPYFNRALNKILKTAQQAA
jgi:hypothetical protein